MHVTIIFLVAVASVNIEYCSANSHKTPGKFNLQCYKRYHREHNDTTVKTVVKVHLDYPKFQSIIIDDTFFIRPSCGIDVYIHGNFFFYSIMIPILEVYCINVDDPGKTIVGEIITSGYTPTTPKKGFPPLPADWWAWGVVGRITFHLHQAYKPSIYRCGVKYKHVKSSYPLHAKATITVEGCPHGKYGVSCQYRCACQNKGMCHPFDGSCLCPKEWTGRFCQKRYPHVEVNGTAKAAYVGEQVDLTCNVYGTNVTSDSIQWFFIYQNGNRTVSQPNPISRISIGTNSSTLSIKTFNDPMAGNYTCAVTTDKGIYHSAWFIATKGCAQNKYGPLCQYSCDCQNRASCDRNSGCVCSQGYIGRNCHISTRLLGLCVGLTAACLLGLTVSIFVVRHMYIVWTRLRQIALVTEEVQAYEALKGNPWKGVLPEISNVTPTDLTDSQLCNIWTISDDDIYFGKQIGEGFSSFVYQGHLVKKGKTYEVAVKMLKDASSSQTVKDFVQEFKTLADIYRHRHILQMLGIGQKEVAGQERQFIVMEYMGKGCLLQVLRTSRITDDVTTLLTKEHLGGFVQDILSGLAYLEVKKIVHRDVAARNMLVSSFMVVKLADFGFSRDVRTDGIYQLQGSQERMLPWKWMAYESLKDRTWTTKSDVWSFGILLWEIVTLGGAPYPGLLEISSLLEKLPQGFRMSRPSHCSTEWYDLMLRCWEITPGRRPSFASLRKDFEKLKLNNQAQPEMSRYEADLFAFEQEMENEFTGGMPYSSLQSLIDHPTIHYNDYHDNIDSYSVLTCENTLA